MVTDRRWLILAVSLSAAFLIWIPMCSAQDWTQLTPSGTLPSARVDSRGFYDAATNRMVIFGGSDSTCGVGSGAMNDVWFLTNANGVGASTWSQVSTAGGPPAGRRAASVGYNSSSNRMIVFGGDKQACGNATQKLNDVWILTNANGNGGTATWTQLAPTGGPPTPRSDNAYVYDQTSNRLTIFAGYSGSANLTDMWVLTNADGTGGTPQWILQSPTGTPPAAGLNFSTAYDQGSNRMILFGGFTCCTAPSPIFNETWILANANGVSTPIWTKLNPTGTLPAKRAGASAGYLPATNQLVIFGGAVEDVAHSGSANGFQPQANDTWILSSANGTSGTPQWQQLTESNPPSARGGSTSTPAVVTDSINSRMTIFGGFHFGAPSPGVSLNDTWVLNAPGVPVTVTTNPSGLAVLVQSASQTAPYTFLCASGGNSTIGVNSPQSAGANQQYAFNNWSDSSVLLSRTIACPASPATYTANFNLQDRVTLATNPAGVGLTVNLDGTPTSTPASPFLSLGNHTLGVTSPQAGAAGIQYTYSSWSDGGAQTHTIDAAASLGGTFTANFTTQYRLTTNANPTGGGTVSPSAGFYNSGSVLSVQATPNSGFQFSGWSGDLTGATNRDRYHERTAERHCELLYHVYLRPDIQQRVIDFRSLKRQHDRRHRFAGHL